MPTDKYDKYAVQDFYDTTKSLDQKQSSLSFFKASDDELVPIRLNEARSIKEGKPLFLCGYCKEPVHICGHLFEVQRTSTNIGTIIGRDDFYRSHGMYVVWVITEPENKTCAKRDIFYDNAENFFVYDEAAQEMSEELHELCLTCYYCKWTFDNNGDYARCNRSKFDIQIHISLTHTRERTCAPAA